MARTTAVIACLALSRRAAAQHVHPPRADSVRGDSTMAAMSGSHDMPGMTGPLGISHVRMGSGTTWMPDASPMYANHKMLGDWTAMFHGVAFGQFDHQGSERGSSQLGVVDWEMAMLMRRVGSGLLHLHAMASLEPLTIGARGYPLLLQTGESYRGAPLHDRQHPHDAVMELAGLFQQPVARDVAVEFYGGIAGEPALGPVAFMHRPSAQNDPLAPLGHHWQDATHVSYGVLTTGVYSRRWKIEGSWFNGREPDEHRWNVDLRGLDSYSGRITVNPTARWSVAGWYGYLASPEALSPEESIRRYGGSAMYAGNGLRGGQWSSTVVWGANAHDGRVENSVLAETNVGIGAKAAMFGRVEYVRKSAADLVLDGLDPEREFDIGALVAGYMREVILIPGGSIGVGGRIALNIVPDAVARFYGTRTPSGFSVFVRARPSRMASAAPHAGPMEMESTRARGPRSRP